MESNISVVLIDSQPVAQLGIRTVLEQNCFTVVACSESLAQGTELTALHRPDITLIDVQLEPEKYTPSTLLNYFVEKSGTRPVVLTTDQRAAVVQMALKMKVAGYLLKTEPPARIVQALRKVAGGFEPVVSRQLIKQYDPLTETDLCLLKNFAKGMRYGEIAQQRGTSPLTVKKQCEFLLIKLGLRSREELISWSATNGYAVC